MLNQVGILTRRARRSNVIQAAAVNYIAVFVAAVASVLVARALGPEGRGQFAALMAWFSLALVVGELGQSGSITHWVAKRREEASNIVATGRLLTILGSLIAGGVALVIAPWLADNDPALVAAYSTAFTVCFLNGVWGPYVYAAQAVSIPAWNLIRIIQPVVYVILIIFLFLTNLLGIVTLAASLVASTAAQLIVGYIIAIRLDLTKGKPSKKNAALLGKYGGAYYASQFPSSISAQYDKVFLSQTVSDSELGQYSVAGTVASLGGPLATAIASVAFPRLSADISGQVVRSRSENRLIALTGGVTALVLLALCFASITFVPWVFGEEFRYSIVLIGLLAPAMWARSLSEVVLVLVRSRGRPGLVIWARFSGLAAGALSILPLISRFGVAGGTFSLMLLESVTLLVSIFLLRTLRHNCQKISNVEQR